MLVAHVYVYMIVAAAAAAASSARGGTRICSTMRKRIRRLHGPQRSARAIIQTARVCQRERAVEYGYVDDDISG